MSNVYFLVDEDLGNNYTVEFISMDLGDVRKEKARLIEVYKELGKQFGFSEDDLVLYKLPVFNIYVAQLNVPHSWEKIE